jgi:hypothetical protein
MVGKHLSVDAVPASLITRLVWAHTWLCLRLVLHVTGQAVACCHWERLAYATLLHGQQGTVLQWRAGASGLRGNEPGLIVGCVQLVACSVSTF